MSKLVIKMVYNPNVLRYSQTPTPTFNSNHQLRVTKVKNIEQASKDLNSSIAFWQDDHNDFSLVTLLIGIIPFALGLQLFISSLFLPEISAYRDIYILLTLVGLMIINPKVSKKNNAKTSLGN